MRLSFLKIRLNCASLIHTPIFIANNKKITMNSLKKTIVITLFILSFNPMIHAQLPVPVIDSLTVTSGNKIQLTWNMNHDERINRFVLYKKQSNDFGFFAFDTISNTQPYTYIDINSNPETNQWQYTIAALSITDSSSTLADHHSNIVVQFIDYQLCQPGVNLEWLPYVGADEIRYSIICTINNQLFDIQDNIFNQTGNIKLRHGTEHRIAVRATWNGGSSTSSVRTYFADSIDIDPTISITRIEDNNSEYNITLSNAATPDRDSVFLDLYRPDNEYPYFTTAFLPAQTNQFTFTLPKTNPITVVKASLSDVCRNIYNQGIKVGTIHLTAIDQQTSVSLQWNLVNNVPNLNYSVYSGNTFIATLGEENEYQYQITSVGFNNEEICFKIIAQNDTLVVISNEACLALIDDLIWPNAFVPDGDGFDDKFGPVVNRFEPDAYVLQIYNKSGLLLFSSNSVYEKWSGVFNGKLVPKGTYIWQSEYTLTGIRKKKQGTVNVIY